MTKYAAKEKITCPHCNKEVVEHLFKRWHSDKSCIEREERKAQEKSDYEIRGLPVNLYSYISTNKISIAEENLKNKKEFWGTRRGFDWWCEKNDYDPSQFEKWVKEDENGQLSFLEMTKEDMNEITKVKGKRYKNWPTNKKIPDYMCIIDGYVIPEEWSDFFPGAEIIEEDYYCDFAERFYLHDGMWYNLKKHKIEDEEKKPVKSLLELIK